MHTRTRLSTHAEAHTHTRAHIPVRVSTCAPVRGHIHTHMDIVCGGIYRLIMADGRTMAPVIAIERSAADPVLWWCLAPDGSLIGAVTWHLLPFDDD